MEETIMGDKEPTIAQLVKSLLDDRKLREQELAEKDQNMSRNSKKNTIIMKKP